MLESGTGRSRSADPTLNIYRAEFSWPGADSFGLSVERLVIRHGERVLLLGPSGSGKSTLLSLICGIAVPQTGDVEILGENLSAMSAKGRDRFRAEHCGIIFQMFNLLPYASALDNVLLPLSFASQRRERVTKHGPARDEAARLLSGLGIDGTLATAGMAAKLSVGQQQRVAAARALIGAPDLIIADEPTSALDKKNQETFLDLLFDQVEEAGATLIMVSHDDRLEPRFNRTLRLGDIAKSTLGENA